MPALPPAPTEAFVEYVREIARRDAECEDRCAGCNGAHGAVRICGGCEEPEGDCVCPPRKILEVPK